jgi:hypothetical protein
MGGFQLAGRIDAGGVRMRKQDRIAAQQNRSSDDADKKTQPREQIKGSGSSDQASKPQRQAGSKLPLPE